MKVIAKRKTRKKAGKPKTLYQVSETAATHLQLLRRLQESDDNGYCTCVTCGATKHYKKMAGGHYIERGKRATKLNPKNIHVQCHDCNGPGMKFHGKLRYYTLFMVDKFGREFVDYLELESKRVVKWYRHELEDLIVDLKAQVKIEEKRVCGYAV